MCIPTIVGCRFVVVNKVTASLLRISVTSWSVLSKMTLSSYLCALGAVIMSISAFYGSFFTVLWILLHCILGGAGFYYAFHWNMKWGKTCKLAIPAQSKSAVNIIVNKMMVSLCAFQTNSFLLRVLEVGNNFIEK